MGTKILVRNVKNAFTRKPSSSKIMSNLPLPNNMSSGVLEGPYIESPRKENTGVQTDIQYQDREPVLQKGDVSHTPLQPTHETMQAFPPKENVPPEKIQEISYRVRQNSMQEPRYLAKENKGLQGQLLETRDTPDTALNNSGARMLKKIQRLEEENQIINEENRRLDGENRRLNEEKQRLESLVVSLDIEKKEAENKIRQQNEDVRNLQHKMRTSEEQRSNTTKLLDDRTAELAAAQAFLTTADRYSGADVIKMVESLNEEIFQVSALTAELVVATSDVESPVQPQDIQAYKDYLDHGRKVIGSQLFSHLATRSNEIRVDHLPLQLAFQALFTWWCVYEVDLQFCEGPTGKGLKEIYKRIYESEIQAIAGRWRVMTSVQTMNSDSSSNADFVLHVILGLMGICGWFKYGTSERALQSVQQAVSRVQKMWKALKVAIMQEITAADITITQVGAGCDYNAAKMDGDMYVGDATMDPDDRAQQTLCTVGVGLQRNVSKRSENGTMQIHRELVLKPKVALASVLLNGESSQCGW